MSVFNCENPSAIVEALTTLENDANIVKLFVYKGLPIYKGSTALAINSK